MIRIFYWIEYMIDSKQAVLNGFGFWKLVLIVFFILYCFRVEGNFDSKLPTYLILVQLFAIESLITARFDSIIK